ncbi:amidase [Aliidiomarina celeris]|uniref:amidase n=1 Tax=Aliidiomarina celeris TaxID=2249428 RepID=UPI0013008EEC|nr:amidase family protein [Aliidiomarina celeris]
MHYLSATAQAEAIRTGSISSEELVHAQLARIYNVNAKLNAFIYNDRERTLKLALRADMASAEEKAARPLNGVPISIKECFLWQDTPSTVNFPLYKNYVAKETSVLVDRLLNAGAVILGKTNVPTLLADSQTFGPLYPTANNPFDLSRTPGGSTGGGAAAVAAGLSALELGSDIGGSIRNPSHYCGLFGLKPTENGYASDGHVPPYPEQNVGVSVMNHTGPLARSAADLELAYSVLYQPDWQRKRYLPINTAPDASIDAQSSLPLKGFKIGYFDTLYGLQAGNDVRKAMSTLSSTLQAQGAEVTRIRIDTQLAERMLKLWGLLFGFMMGQNLSWPLRKLFYLKFTPALKASRLPAAGELKTGLSLNFKAFSAALREREELIAEVNRSFAGLNAVISPTSLGPAFSHNPKHKGIVLDGETIPYIDYCFPFVAFYNLTGHPVLTLPTGLNGEGLPIGLSLSAPHHHESALLALGKHLEASGYAFTPPETFA